MSDLRRKDIASDDIFTIAEDLAKSFKKGYGEIKKDTEELNKQLHKTFQAAKEARDATAKATTTRESTESIKKLTKAQNELTKSQKLAIDMAKKAEQAAVRQANEEKKLTVEYQKGQVQRTEKIRQLKQEARQALGLDGPYKRLSIRLEEARRKYKDLAASQGLNSKAAQNQLGVVRKLDNQLKTIDTTAGQFGRVVGNYPRVFSLATGALTKFLGAFGLLGGIALFARTMTGVVKMFADFEKANSNLQAVSGATATQMAEMRKQARGLGETTAFSASQVTELQVELAKLGFPVQDIKNMTASTLDAALAMGSGLADTAKLTGATLKAFKLDSTEAARVNDVLAKATASSALDFEKLNTSMSTIAPVANAFGFELEDTVALLGELSNAGFDASAAATATRNILLNLADANGSLAKKIGEPVRDLPSLVAGLGKLESQGIDLAEALELTDKRSVAAFSTFLSGRQSLLSLGNTLRGAAGSAREMARIMEDNLLGDAKLFKSAWEGLVLSLTAGDSVFNRLTRGIVQLATSFLSLLTPTEKMNRGFEEQRDFVKELDGTLPGFIDRYEELAKKTNRNQEENEELRKVTAKIAEIVPTAVTEWTKYGEALGINTGKAQEFLDAQKALLSVKNEEEIRKNEKALEGYEQVLTRITKTLNQGSEIVTEFSDGMSVNSREVKLTDERITHLLGIQADFNQKIQGTRLLLLELTGDVEKYGNTIEDDLVDPTDDGADKVDKLAESIKKLGQAFASSLRGKGAQELLDIQEELKRKQAELIFQLDQMIESNKKNNDEIDDSVDGIDDLTDVNKKLKAELDLVGKQLTFVDHAMNLIPEHIEEWKSLQSAIEGAGKSLDDFLRDFEIANQKFVNAFSTEDLNKLSDPVDDLVSKLINEGGDASEAFANDYKTAMDEVAAAIDFVNKQEEEADEKRRKRQEAATEGLNLLSEIYRGFADLRIQQISDELNALQHKRDKEIEFINESGATDEQKEARIAATNAKFDAQERALKNKQVQAEKRAALFQIAIQTAINAVTAFGRGGIAGIALALALGAAQAAFVAAQPVPQFEEGTKGKKYTGPGVWGHGTEMAIEGNKVRLSPPKPTLSFFKNAEILPADMTSRLLATSLLGNISLDSRQTDDSRMIKTMNDNFKSLEKTIRKKPAHIIQGRIVGSQVDGTKLRKINNLRY